MFHILRETSGFPSKPLSGDQESGDREGEWGRGFRSETALDVLEDFLPGESLPGEVDWEDSSRGVLLSSGKGIA